MNIRPLRYVLLGLQQAILRLMDNGRKLTVTYGEVATSETPAKPHSQIIKNRSRHIMVERISEILWARPRSGYYNILEYGMKMSLPLLLYVALKRWRVRYLPKDNHCTHQYYRYSSIPSTDIVGVKCLGRTINVPWCPERYGISRKISVSLCLYRIATWDGTGPVSATF